MKKADECLSFEADAFKSSVGKYPKSELVQKELPGQFSNNQRFKHTTCILINISSVLVKWKMQKRTLIISQLLFRPNMPRKENFGKNL
ncbi:MAG: hypothetical protein R2788_23585 [Saprospiraceae bacterium]